MNKIKKLYYKICEKIGYLLVVRVHYDPATFTPSNGRHIVLFKFIGSRDDAGWIKLKQVFTVKIR